MALSKSHKMVPKSIHQEFRGDGVASEPRDKRHRLSGVRLGILERTLLVAAPSVDNVFGMKIEAPERTRSAMQGYLRAARKLGSVGLLHRAHVQSLRRAHDPRRERFFYDRGRFFKWLDPSRRHVSQHVMVWQTRFGQGIAIAFARELSSGRPIRWTPTKVARAEHFARIHSENPHARRSAVDSMRGAVEDAAEEEPPARVVEVRPDYVRDPADVQRWHLSIAVARRASARLTAAELWVDSEQVFSSHRPLEELLEAAGTKKQTAAKPPLRFTRSPLGWIKHTDPEVARAWDEVQSESARRRG
jgi:hypothetical protein